VTRPASFWESRCVSPQPHARTRKSSLLAPHAASIVQGFPYRQGLSLTEFLLDTIVGGAIAVGGDCNESKAHDFAAAYAQSSLCALQRRRALEGVSAHQLKTPPSRQVCAGSARARWLAAFIDSLY
jgi:hypothetical protein